MSTTSRWLLAAIVLVALAVRVAWVLYGDFEPTLSDDAGRYDFLGRSLAAGGGYVNPNGNTTLFWPPAYPFVLAAVYKLFDGEVIAALLLNAVLGASTVALVYAIGRRVFSERAALVAATLYTLLPSAVFLAGTTLTETPFTFFAFLAVWLIIEAEERRDMRLIFVVGLITGFAALIRGQATMLAIVALPFWLSASGSWRAAAVRAAVAGGLTLAVVAPWTIRNFVESDRLVLISSNAGVDFYIGHSAGADGRRRKVDELVFQYAELPPARAEAKVNAEGFREGLSYAARHPLREVELAGRKLFWLYRDDHEALRWTEAHGEREFLPDLMRDVLDAISDVYYWGLLGLAAAGAAAWVSLRQPARLLLVSLVTYWTLVHVVSFADPRFHAPVMPVACLWAAAGAVWLWDRAPIVRGGHRE